MNENIFDIEQVLNATTDEKERIDQMNNFSWALRDSNIKKAIQLAQQANRLSLRLEDGSIYEKGLAYSCSHLGFFHHTSSQYEDALIRLLQARKMFVSIKDRLGEADALSRMGLVYWGIGEFDKALSLVFEAISISKKDENQPRVAWYYFTLGTFYYDLKDHELSLQYYEKAIFIFYENNEKIGIARCKNGVGSVYEALKSYDYALDSHETAFKLQKEINDNNGMSRSLNDIGNIYLELGDYEKALIYYNESIAIRKQIGNKQSTITTLLNLGKLYTKTKNYEKALIYLKNALDIAQEINARPKVYRIHEAIAEVYKYLKEPWLALEHYEQFVTIKADILGEEVNTRIKNLQTSFAVEKSEKEAEIYKISNQKLKSAYKEIEQKSQQILDSIRYAKHIQEAIMPNKGYVLNFLPETFIYYEPKDIVSGDFYWFSVINNNNHTEFILAAIDCTGHGVPGAFMTVLANSLLSQIINETNIYQPAEILNQLDRKVTAMLQKHSSFEGYYQGMDVALCKINLNTQSLTFAGAKRPLYYVREHEMNIIKGNTFPIGASQYRSNVIFDEHKLEILPGDILYLFTDGYQDQFGEKEGRKLMQRNFRNILLQISNLPMEEQLEFLENYIKGWKGNLEQTDDVLVIGAKF